MAVTRDGDNFFGVQTKTVTINSITFEVQSYTPDFPSDTVDLKNGQGLTIDRTYVPGVVGFTMTLIYGSSETGEAAYETIIPRGEEFNYDDSGVGTARAHIVGSVQRPVPQGEYWTITITGHRKINVT